MAKEGLSEAMVQTTELILLWEGYKCFLFIMKPWWVTLDRLLWKANNVSVINNNN